MHYFAYGSNMSLSRLRERTPSAVALGRHFLFGHDLRFHKSGRDGSGKCDAYFTSDPVDVIHGVLFDIDPDEKEDLDEAEGLGFGYDEKEVDVTSPDAATIRATTYVATSIDERLKPYSWYLHHVLIGAREASLPDDYVESKIRSVESVEDPDEHRNARERALHG